MRGWKWLVLLGSMWFCSLGLHAQTQAVKIVDRIVAQVNDDIITQSDIKREMVGIQEELAQKYTGAQLEQAMKKEEAAILDLLVQRKLFLQKANEYGIGSGLDVRVSAQIEEVRQKNNIKTMEELEQALEAQGMTLAAYREMIKREMIIGILLNEFVDSRITLLTEEVERYYKDHAKDFSSPAEVTLSEILLPTGGDGGQAESQLNEYRKRALQGESFAELASQYSKGPTASKGGGIGAFQLGKLSQQLAAAVAPLKEGEISQVIKMPEGYAIYRVDQLTESIVRPFNEVQDQIKQLLYEQKRTPEFNRYIAQLKEDAYIQYFPEIGIGK